MWPSLLIKLSMLIATIGVVFWIGWTAPNTATPPAQDGVQSVSASNSISSSTTIHSPASTLPPPAPAASSGPGTSRLREKQEQPKLDLNRASAQDLEELPGIGPVLAERIVAHRKSGQTFRTIEDLREVKGIGKKKFEQIRALVVVTPPTPQSQKGKKAA